MHIKRYLDVGRVFGIGTLGGFLASFLLYVVILAVTSVFGCQPPGSQTPGQESGFGVENISVEGQCDAKISLVVRTPMINIPIGAKVNSVVVENKHTVGAAILTLMGGVSQSVCEVDTRNEPSWKCRAQVLGRDVAKPSVPAIAHPASPPTSAPYYDPTDPL